MRLSSSTWWHNQDHSPLPAAPTKPSLVTGEPPYYPQLEGQGSWMVWYVLPKVKHFAFWLLYKVALLSPRSHSLACPFLHNRPHKNSRVSLHLLGPCSETAVSSPQPHPPILHNCAVTSPSLSPKRVLLLSGLRPMSCLSALTMGTA